MTTSSCCDCDIRTTFPAIPEAVDLLSLEFRRRARSRLAHRQCFLAELLIREALNNAVFHGCGADPQRDVRCRLRLRGRRLVVSVHDDGAGFDWRAAVQKPPGAAEVSGRGISILLAFATRIRFNKRGNHVTIVKQF